MADYTQVERQLYILSLLSQERRGFTIEEILVELGKMGIDISRKTVERDLDSITRFFYVYEEEKGGVTRYFANKVNVSNVAFSIPELLSLYFAKEVLKSYKGLEIGSTAVRMIEEIIDAGPKIQKRYLDNLNSLLKINVTSISPERDINPVFLDLLKKAVEECRCIDLEYYAFNQNEITKRRFEPYILEIYEGCWHVVGHCRLRNRIRDFRVSRIQSLEISDEVVIRPEAFYENYMRKRFNYLAGDEEVILRLFFTGQAARIVEEYECNKADKLIKSNNGLIFERRVALAPEVLRWVLGFGAEVEVLEPDCLRDAVLSQVRKMKDIYDP